MIPLYFDSTFILIIPAIILSIYAQWKVSHVFKKFSKIPSARGMKGAEIAKQMLYQEGINNVDIELVQGKLSDHYDPKKKVLRLSPEVHSSSSLSAIGVAAHEAGHAIQHAHGYWPLVLRTSFYPVANIGSKLAFVLIILGFFLSTPFFLKIGIIFFAASVFFTLITLPVEFNASKRALSTIEQYGIVNTEELKGCKKVLNAAALTYVAAALTAILQLVRLIILARGRD